MPTILTHTAVPLALGLGPGQRVVSSRLLLAGILASIAPDLDIAGWRLGIANSARRWTPKPHAPACLRADARPAAARPLRTTRRCAFVFVLASAASRLTPGPKVAGFDIFQVHGTRSLVVQVTGPGGYANRGGAIRRALNKSNVCLCGSPVAMTSSSLKIDADDLLGLCNAHLEKYGSPEARSCCLGSMSCRSAPSSDGAAALRCARTP
jgi:hypothetical protein